MWLSAMLLGFVGFLAAMFALIERGFDSHGRWQRAGWLWLGVAALCFALWIVALPHIARP